MKMLQRVLTVFAIAALVFIPVSCRQKGPLERGGEKVDKAVENAGDKVKDATTPK